MYKKIGVLVLVLFSCIFSSDFCEGWNMGFVESVLRFYHEADRDSLTISECPKDVPDSLSFKDGYRYGFVTAKYKIDNNLIR